PFTPVKCLAYHPNQPVLAVGTTQGVTFWNTTAPGKKMQLLDDNKKPVFAVDFSPDGKMLAIACQGKNRVNMVEVCDLDTKKPVLQYTVNASAVTFSRDGQWLAAARREAFPAKLGAVLVWRVSALHEDKYKPETLSGAAPFYCVAFSPDGK